MPSTERLRFEEAARRSRRVGSIFNAWCSGYEAALARRRAYPDHAGEFMGSLGTWWMRGYRHGLKQRPRLEQFDLFVMGEA